MHTYTRGCTWTCASEGLKSGWKRRVRLERDTRPTAHVLWAKISIRPALRTLQNRFWEKVRLFCNPDLDFLIEIHPEDGFLGGEIRFRISRSIGKSGFRFWKSKSGFPNQTHPKRSIDKIQWFVWNFIPSSFHWNGTVECRKVYELLTVAYLPSLAWGRGSNTLREWGTVKPDAHPLVAYV